MVEAFLNESVQKLSKDRMIQIWSFFREHVKTRRFVASFMTHGNKKGKFRSIHSNPSQLRQRFNEESYH